MVLNARRRSATPALVVPDEMSWTMWGVDPHGLGLTPASTAEQARTLLAPTSVPPALAEAVAAEWRRVPLAADPTVLDAPLRGQPLEQALAETGAQRPRDGAEGHAHGQHDEHASHDQRAEHADHHGHGGHGDHDHHDMMAIVGEPSRDGLVMEPIDLTFGPLSGVLPGGLVAEVVLDGDVVEHCEVRALLVAGRDGDAPVLDALSPVAWRVARLVATEVASGVIADARAQWSRFAAVEAERALSHLVWLRSLARLLGWPQLVDAAQAVLTPLADGDRLAAVSPGPVQVVTATQALTPVLRLVTGRRFARRLGGRGTSRGRSSELYGPNARAAGAARDVRSRDPLYAELGFVPTVHAAGDALGRALVRVEEARASLELAAAALDRSTAAAAGRPGEPSALADEAGASIEGPRGPIFASRAAPTSELLVAAPGGDAARRAAGEAAQGQEWAAALLTLVSFDLSPWAMTA